MTIRAAVAEHVRSAWWEIAITAAILLPAFALDVLIVQTGHLSISERCWNACDAHPLIAVAGFTAGLIPAYLTRRSWVCACAWFGVAAHLTTFVGGR